MNLSRDHPPGATLPQGRTVGRRHRGVAGSSNVGLLPHGVREGLEGRGSLDSEKVLLKRWPVESNGEGCQGKKGERKQRAAWSEGSLGMGEQQWGGALAAAGRGGRGHGRPEGCVPQGHRCQKHPSVPPQGGERQGEGAEVR